MAFNEILVGRLNRYAQKLLQIKNTALRSLSPDLQTVLPLYVGVEDRYLQGWNRYAQDFLQSAVAAQFSLGEIRNPKNSGVIIVIESVIIRSGATQTNGISVQATTADQTTVSTGQVIRLDPRGGPTPSAILSIGGNATEPTTNAANNFAAVVASTSFQFIQNPNQEWTVLPGDAFFIFTAAVNLILSASVVWRERVLESSESS